jgi:hypothetical protein
MSIAMTGTGGLFTRVGRTGRMANDMRVYQLDIGSIIETLMEQFNTENWRQYVQQVPQGDLNARLQAESLINSVLVQATTAALVAQVAADRPSAGGSTSAALLELITQMIAGGYYVNPCTVGASTAAYTNTGNGNVIVSTKRGDGLIQQTLYPEIAPIICSRDSQTGNATSGQEQFSYVGAIGISDVWAWNYPIGSGTTTTFNAIDATLNASGGNSLTNSTFNLWGGTTANTPNQWIKTSGTAGTDFLANTNATYIYTTGHTNSLKFASTGATCGLSQVFSSLATGTAGILQPLSSYAVNFALKADGVISAGVLTVDLYDTVAATVVQDAQGVNNSFTVTLSAVTGSWVWHTGVFRLPTFIPPTTVLRVRITTGLAGANLYLDHLGMGALTRTYPGGPGVAVFSGNQEFIQGDGWDMTTTNDYASASNLSTFQWLFDRIFGLRNIGLLLPYAGSTLIADTLITS